jgi:hypothetical protein
MKRRDIIAASAGIAGGLISGLARAAIPCPPSPVNVAGGGSATTPCVPGASYSTNFAGTENPLSEGGVWTLGRTTGLAWNNPQKSGGRAFGSQTPHPPPPFDDSIAHLSGFPANQSAQGTIYSSGTFGGLEVELLLRFQITANNARGYEVDLYRGGGSVHIVRWNGPLNSFTDLSGAVTQNVSFNDGDVWYAEMVGNVITVKCNNGLVWQSDRTGDATIWTTGNPGMGFYVDTNLGTPSANNTFGWKSFTATGL